MGLFDVWEGQDSEGRDVLKLGARPRGKRRGYARKGPAGGYAMAETGRKYGLRRRGLFLTVATHTLIG
jgi:hypothetical protein